MESLPLGMDIANTLLSYIKDEVGSDHFRKLNSHYRPYPNSDNNSPIIWQQMPINFFYNLLYSKKLFFKCLKGYTDRDERPLTFYRGTYFVGLDEKTQKRLESIINDFSQTAYISCWYQSASLTDIVFKEYAKGSVGVAIGTDVNTLIHSLAALESTSERCQDRLFYGNTVYLNDRCCVNKKLTKSSDLITPLFIKSENHNDDKEFRLVYVKNSDYKMNGRFSSATLERSKKGVAEEAEEKEQDAKNKIGENIYISIKDLKVLIKKVAVRKDDKFTLNLTRYLMEQLLDYSSKEDNSIDGFTILNS